MACIQFEDLYVRTLPHTDMHFHTRTQIRVRRPFSITLINPEPYITAEHNIDSKMNKHAKRTAQRQSVQYRRAKQGKVA